MPVVSRIIPDEISGDIREMNGQWVGRYSGTSNGLALVDIEDLGEDYLVQAYLIDDDTKMPLAMVAFRVSNKSKTFSQKQVYIQPINPHTSEPTDWDRIKEAYPGANFPKSAEVEGSWDENNLTFKWNTDIQTKGECILPRSKAESPSEYKAIPSINNWDDFKKEIACNLVPIGTGRRFLFRGQNDGWRLRTKFHRLGRTNLYKFLFEDKKSLHAHLSFRTRHIFDLNKGEENGAFLNLIQHHGYPTPLLDWTFSPFVAAFFAYRGIKKQEASEAKEDRKVRIFVFDQQEWKKDTQPVLSLTWPLPYLSIMEFIAIDNERMIPQQAVSIVSNIDDIESHIRTKEADKKKEYLRIIELPWSERKRVMHELSIMGITAGSLFPGIDGVCEEMRERLFEK